jgi:hypothetical protein
MTRVKRAFARTLPGLYARMSVARHRLRFAGMDGPHLFTTMFHRNFWGAESRSGAGSDLIQTARIREVLPGFLKTLGVRSLLDVPCGDFYWMRHVELDLDQYIGADVVGPLIQANTQSFAVDKRSFVVRDLTRDALPKADLILCRDCLVHLSFDDIQRALTNINRSGARYLLTTTFTDRTANADIGTGEWRPLNLEKAPFRFPAPLHVINEGCTEGGGHYADKCLALWRLPVSL